MTYVNDRAWFLFLVLNYIWSIHTNFSTTVDTVISLFSGLLPVTYGWWLVLIIGLWDLEIIPFADTCKHRMLQCCAWVTLPLNYQSDPVVISSWKGKSNTTLFRWLCRNETFFFVAGLFWSSQPKIEIEWEKYIDKTRGRVFYRGKREILCYPSAHRPFFYSRDSPPSSDPSVSSLWMPVSCHTSSRPLHRLLEVCPVSSNPFLYTHS